MDKLKDKTEIVKLELLTQNVPEVCCLTFLSFLNNFFLQCRREQERGATRHGSISEMRVSRLDGYDREVSAHVAR